VMLSPMAAPCLGGKQEQRPTGRVLFATAYVFPRLRNTAVRTNSTSITAAPSPAAFRRILRRALWRSRQLGDNRVRMFPNRSPIRPVKRGPRPRSKRSETDRFAPPSSGTIPARRWPNGTARVSYLHSPREKPIGSGGGRRRVADRLDRPHDHHSYPHRRIMECGADAGTPGPAG
jgi:hypothetical protein